MKKKNRFFKAVFSHVNYFLKKNYSDNVPALAGQSAFFLMLSIVPFLMFAFSVISLVTGKTMLNIKIPEFDTQTYPFLMRILNFVTDSVRKSNTFTTITTAVVALWSAGKGLYCITEGISRIYRLPNTRFWITKRIFAMGYTFVILLILLLGLATITVNFIFADAIAVYLGNNTVIRRILYIFFYLLFGIIQTLLMSLSVKLYLHGKVKDKRIHSIRALFPGMFLTVIAWNLLTLGILIYIRNFAVSSIYGSLASVFMIMMWIYFIMYILLSGVQLNYIYRIPFNRFRLFKKHKGDST